MLLTDLIDRAAALHPDKEAVVTTSGSLSFSALSRQSNQVASRLRKLGIAHHSRVAVIHENGLLPVVFFWGILKAGAQVVTVPYLCGAQTIAAILDEAQPEAIVTSEYHLRRLSDASPASLPKIIFTAETLQSSFSTRNHDLREISAVEPCEGRRAPANASEVAVIVYTSGTTGQPKGVMLSHHNLVSNIEAVNRLMGLTSDDSLLVVVPLHFIHGIMQLLTHAMIGGTLVFSDGFRFPPCVLNELKKHKVTGLSGVPYHYLTLLDHTQLASTSLPALRYVVVTGGALSADALRRLSTALPGVAIHIGYGQTEASPRMTNLSPDDVLTHPNSVGKAIPGVRVDILDLGGSPVNLGSIGEVVVSGPNIMRGYVSGDEIALGKIDREGRLHTGDLGRFDSEGYLYLTGRASDLIKTAGERVFPREIECVLEAHRAVREVAVFGIPDSVLGEKIVASAVLRPGTRVTPEELRTHCLKSLPLVRVPREIRFCDSLPKTGSGKIERKRLASHFNEINLVNERAS